MLAKKFLNYQRLLSRLIHFQIFRDYFDSFCDMNTKISNYIYIINDYFDSFCDMNTKISNYIYIINIILTKTYVKSKGYKLWEFGNKLLFWFFALYEESFF